MMEVLVPSKATQRESQAILDSIQSDIKIANLKAEIKHLKILLIGATTPSTVTESSTPKISSTNDRMSTIEKNMEKMTTQFTTWMTKMRRNDTVAESQNPTDHIAHHHEPIQAMEISQQGSQKKDSQ
jgi:uncharacterized protein with GYD domain